MSVENRLRTAAAEVRRAAAAVPVPRRRPGTGSAAAPTVGTGGSSPWPSPPCSWWRC
jgi:hypothetical protein